MIEATICGSLVILIIFYLYFSRRERSFINVLTPSVLILVPTSYVLELVHIYYFGYSGDEVWYLYCYLTYAVSIVAFGLAYLLTPQYKVKLPFVRSRRDRWLIPYLFLAGAVLLYLPIIWEYRDLLSTPREIYTRTRSGYGPLFFLSATSAYLGFISYLFRPRIRTWKIAFFFLFSACVLLLHGSKGQVVTLVLILIMYLVYVREVRVGFNKFLLWAGVFSLGVTLLFLVTLPAQNNSSLIQRMSSYSDYTRNAIVVMSSNMPLMGGQLSVENELFARIPRAIFPDKPKDFGSFFLAKLFYPDWYEVDSGSPAFGIGVQYADFGAAAIFIILCWSILSGVLLKIFVVRLHDYKTPSDFIMVLFLSGVALLSVGVGYMLPEHLLLALGVSAVYRFRVLHSRQTFSESKA